MISADHRFHGRNSLNYVYRRGQTLRSKYFSAKFAVNERRDSYRAAIVVSKKVSKSAPMRNRIRRRLYELVRTEAAPRLGNVDIVITVFDEKVAEIPTSELKSVFTRMVKELGSSLRG